MTPQSLIALIGPTFCELKVLARKHRPNLFLVATTPIPRVIRVLERAGNFKV